MDGRGMYASSQMWVPAFILVMKMHAVEGEKSVSLSFPFAVTGPAQKARLHVQGSKYLRVWLISDRKPSAQPW